MKAEQVDVYRCPSCNEAYIDEPEAIECCGLTSELAWQCSECDELYEREDQADACCTGEEIEG